ncbi:hypothetical protein OSTOST_07954, partial [Ostertagia ostertagi]
MYGTGDQCSLGKRNKNVRYAQVVLSHKENSKHTLLLSPLSWHAWLTAATFFCFLGVSLASHHHGVSAHCVRGGVHVIGLETTEKIEVCGNDHCLEIVSPETNFTIQFPAEVVLHHHIVTLKSRQGNATNTVQISCEPSPFCEQIACSFCSTMISNPHCWPRIAIMATSILLYAIVMTVAITFLCIRKALKLTKKGCGCMMNLLKYTVYRLYRLTVGSTHSDAAEMPLIELNTRVDRWRPSSIIRILAVCFTLINKLPRLYKLELKENIQESHADTKLQLTALYVHPLSLMNSRFIKSSHSTAILDPQSQFHFACVSHISNSTDKLSDCATTNSCTCHPAEDEISCFCEDQQITSLFELRRTLPITLPSATINPSEAYSVTIATKAANAELALSISSKVKNLTMLVDTFECSITVTELQGCYNCIAGATARLTCAASIPHGIADVQCNTQSFIITCTREGYHNSVRIYAQLAQFHQVCKAKCGIKNYIFEIKGILHYINPINPIHSVGKLLGGKDEYDLDSFSLPDIWHIFNNFKKYILFSFLAFQMSNDGEQQPRTNEPSDSPAQPLPSPNPVSFDFSSTIAPENPQLEPLQPYQQSNQWYGPQPNYPPINQWYGAQPCCPSYVELAQSVNGLESAVQGLGKQVEKLTREMQIRNTRLLKRRATSVEQSSAPAAKKPKTPPLA